MMNSDRQTENIAASAATSPIPTVIVGPLPTTIDAVADDERDCREADHPSSSAAPLRASRR